jgi:hypothetical protein
LPRFKSHGISSKSNYYLELLTIYLEINRSRTSLGLAAALSLKSKQKYHHIEAVQTAKIAQNQFNNLD